eukprot:scaffold3870_cov246-Pinguiococcus_pyrenoidosus.AAC.19
MNMRRGRGGRWGGNVRRQHIRKRKRKGRRRRYASGMETGSTMPNELRSKRAHRLKSTKLGVRALFLRLGKDCRVGRRRAAATEAAKKKEGKRGFENSRRVRQVVQRQATCCKRVAASGAWEKSMKKRKIQV